MGATIPSQASTQLPYVPTCQAHGRTRVNNVTLGFCADLWNAFSSNEHASSTEGTTDFLFGTDPGREAC